MTHVAVEKVTLQEKVHCWLQYNATKRKVIENKICEGTDCLKAAWSSDVTRLERIIAPTIIVGWRSSDKMSFLYVLPLPSTRKCVVKTQGSKYLDSLFWWDSPFTQQITLCFLYCFSGLWAFCQAVVLLIYVVAMKVWSCHELDPQHIIHIQGFITPDFVIISYD